VKSLLSFSIFALIIFLIGFSVFSFLNEKLLPNIGQLAVNVSGQNATVYLDGKKLGKTPLYRKNLRLGEHQINVEPENSPQGFSWKTNIILTKSTVSTIDLDLGPSLLFTSGESLYFRPGNKTVTILSRPDKAKVFLGTKEVGKTPLTFSLEKGVHNLVIKKEGYFTREVPINMEDGYKLSAVIYLSINPFYQVKKISGNGKLSLFTISNSEKDLLNNTYEWVEGIRFVQKNFSSAETKFDYLIDQKGNGYELNKDEWENKQKTKANSVVGYLSRSGETELSEQAKKTWEELKKKFD